MKNAPSRSAPDITLLFITLVLVAVGVVMVFSASVAAGSRMGAVTDPFMFLKRQAVWVLVGLGALLWASRVNVMKLRTLSFGGLVAAVGLLALVLIPHVGLEANGARRWLGYGAFTFQPAELAKLALILYLADTLARRGDRIKDLKRLFPAVLVTVLLFFLVEKEPDLGSALVLVGTAFAMLFMAGARLSHLVSMFAIGAGVIGVSVLHHAYRMQRLTAFLDPWSDPQGTGYHVIQSLLALGSGGLWGVGLGMSHQKFYYLPEPHTDFIFAVLGEELGLVGTLVVVGLFAWLVYRGLKVAVGATHPFLNLLAGGLTFQLGLQAMINIGMVTAAIPAVGVPLPFISYGGTSLVVSMAAVGLLLNISSYKYERLAQKPESGSDKVTSLESRRYAGRSLS